MFALFLTLPILLTSTMPITATPDTGFPGPAATWTLSELDGAAFDASATLSFFEDGRIGGKAPCNSYNGPITGTPEKFEIGNMVSTRMACPQMDLENTFLTALGTMTSAEQTDTLLTLRNGEGRQMVFTPASE